VPVYQGKAFTYLGIATLQDVTWGHVFICVIGFLLVFMSFDNLVESFQKQPAKAFYCLLAPSILIAQSYFQAQLPIFYAHTQTVFILYQMVFNTYILKFMVNNMCKKTLSYFNHLELFLPSVAILAAPYFSEAENLLVLRSLLGITVLYYSYIYIALSR